jgi:hypothetical protein
VAPFVTIVVIALVAWRYRRALGLSKRWDEFGRDHAGDLAARLGWSNRKGPGGPTRASTARTAVARSTRRSFFPRFDTRRLPVALVVGACEAVIVLGLDLGGHDFLSFVVGIVVGPFIGGVYVRSYWWLLVAAVAAIVVGAGGEIGPLLVAVPVAAIGYVGIRTDVAGWIARLNAEPDEPSR